VLPSVGRIDGYLSEILKATIDLDSHPKSNGEGSALRRKVMRLARVAGDQPESRDLIASRLGELKAKTQNLLDHTNVFVTPQVDDLDNYLQGILDEVSRTKIPDPDDISAKSHTTKLMPLDPWGEDALDKYAYPRKGAYRDNMEWQHHPWTENKHDLRAPNKVNGDRFAPADNKYVHGSTHVTNGPVTNPYGAFREHDQYVDPEGKAPTEENWGRGDAEVRATSADGMDARRADGVMTGEGVTRGAKLCSLVNCQPINLLPRAKQLRTSTLAGGGARR